MSSNVTLKSYNLTPPPRPSTAVFFRDRMGDLCQVFQGDSGNEESHKNIYNARLSDTSTWETFCACLFFSCAQETRGV